MKTFVLTLLILMGCFVTISAQNKGKLKYGKNQANWNNTLKQDWFNHDPNKLLSETIRGLKPGTALDVAMGEGRNTIFLAQNGWKVTGFDIANEAVNSVRLVANQLDVEVTAVHASREDFNFGKRKWDLIVLSYIDVICGGCIANDDFIEVLEESIKRNGLVVYEMAHRDWYQENWEDPGDWGCTEDWLINLFETHGFEVLLCEAVVEKADWTIEPGKILKFVAKKH